MFLYFFADTESFSDRDRLVAEWWCYLISIALSHTDAINIQMTRRARWSTALSQIHHPM